MTQTRNKRILFISPFFPKDLRTAVHGTYKRMQTIIEALKQLGTIDMLFFVDSDRPSFSENETREIEKSLSEHWDCEINLTLCPIKEIKGEDKLKLWLSFARGIFSFYDQPNKKPYNDNAQVQAVKKCLQRNPDAIFAHRIGTIGPLMQIKDQTLPPVFFDLDDVEHVMLKRYIRNRKNLKSNLLSLMIPTLTKGEYEAVKFAAKTFVCSESDREYLSQKFKLPGIVAVPNAINVPELKPLTTEPTLLYLSSGYLPNQQAGEILVNEIWPIVRKQIPNAKLIIAGKYKYSFNFRENDIPGLELPGFVEDLDALYESVRATAVPLLIGGGTRFKIIEAAMYGKPTVSTSIGAEGIELTDKTEILIEDDTAAFADACIELLADYELSRKIGLAARKKAVELYDSRKVATAIKEEILKELQ